MLSKFTKYKNYINPEWKNIKFNYELTFYYYNIININNVIL